MSRVAVVGSGIAGMATAYLLSQKHLVHLLERDERIGGHTHTHTVETCRGPLPIDTGFIVHNDRTYPNLVKLLEDGIRVQQPGYGRFFCAEKQLVASRPLPLSP